MLPKNNRRFTKTEWQKIKQLASAKGKVYHSATRAKNHIKAQGGNMPKRKRYFFSVVEEVIMNSKYQDYRGGRIEVYDRKDKSGYACYEARFFIPKEFINSFRETWDFKESDEMPFIHWDYSEVK